MKATVIKRYTDKDTHITHAVGDMVEYEQERGSFLAVRGFIQPEVEETTPAPEKPLEGPAAGESVIIKEEPGEDSEHAVVGDEDQAGDQPAEDSEAAIATDDESVVGVAADNDQPSPDEDSKGNKPAGKRRSKH